MERVLVNLLSNALKFTSTGGVTVTLDSKDGEVEISVVGTGIGIAPEVLPKIFERFSQGDGSVTRRYGGTGIGLAYAKEIVELHGGQLTGESTPGQGSRFVVHLREGADVIPEGVRDRRFGSTADGKTERRRQEDQEPQEWAQRLQRQMEYRFSEIEQRDRTPAGVARARRRRMRRRMLVVEDNAEILELVNLQLRRPLSGLRRPERAAGAGAGPARAAGSDRHGLHDAGDGWAQHGEGRCGRTRSSPRPPVIMLTAKNHLEDRLAGREAGVGHLPGQALQPARARGGGPAAAAEARAAYPQHHARPCRGAGDRQRRAGPRDSQSAQLHQEVRSS